jgi:hypothetical protein
VAEGARLESVCTSQAYRGFESRSLRKRKPVRRQTNGFCCFKTVINPSLSKGLKQQNPEIRLEGGEQVFMFALDFLIRDHVSNPPS